MKSLLDQFKELDDSKKATIVELQNKDHIPVGAIYLNLLKYENASISETKISEKYILVVDGLAVFFTYWEWR